MKPLTCWPIYRWMSSIWNAYGTSLMLVRLKGERWVCLGLSMTWTSAMQKEPPPVTSPYPSTIPSSAQASPLRWSYSLMINGSQCHMVQKRVKTSASETKILMKSICLRLRTNGMSSTSIWNAWKRPTVCLRDCWMISPSRMRRNVQQCWIGSFLWACYSSSIRTVIVIRRKSSNGSWKPMRQRHWSCSRKK